MCAGLGSETVGCCLSHEPGISESRFEVGVRSRARPGSHVKSPAAMWMSGTRRLGEDAETYRRSQPASQVGVRGAGGARRCVDCWVICDRRVRHAHARAGEAARGERMCACSRVLVPEVVEDAVFYCGTSSSFVFWETRSNRTGYRARLHIDNSARVN